MASKKKWLGMLIFGIVGIWNIYAQTDNRLNGTWVQVQEGIQFELRLRNGNFEELYNNELFRKGTFSTNIKELTIIPTHIHGAGFKFIMGDTENELGLESKWYSFNEFIITMRATLLRFGLSEREVNEFVEAAVSSNTTSTYSVDGNTLILVSSVQGQNITVILTKK
jgi:hypothetical protein